MSIYFLNDIYYNEIPGYRPPEEINENAVVEKNDNNNDDVEVSYYESFDEGEDNEATETKPELHASKVLHNLQDQRKNNSASLDMVIKILIDEKVVLLPVHKFLASACCPYIKSCLDNMPESKISTIDLSHLNGESVTEIINWMYTGVCNLTPSTAQDVLISADFMCIDDIIRLSTNFISCHLTYENCSDMYVLSYSYETFRFRERVQAYIVRNFYPLLSESHLNELPLQEILDLSSSDDLILFSHKFIDLDPANHEFKLFQMIRDYLEAKNLQDFWFDFLTKSIRVIHLTADQIKDLISVHRWLGNCKKKNECIDLLQDVLDKKEQNSLNFKYKIHVMRRKILKGFKYVTTEIIARHGMFDEAYPDSFDDLDSERERMKHSESLVMIRAMKIFLREWDDLLVIGGMEVTYTDNTKYSHGLNEDVSMGVHEFQLKDGEYINRVEYKCGHVIDALTFHTNFGTKHGPYGGRGGGGGVFTPPKKCGFLAAVSGETTTSRNIPIVRFMNFYWGLPSKNLRMYFG